MTYRNWISNQSVLCGVLIGGLLFAQCIGAAAVPRTEATVWQETLPALRIQVDSRRNRLWVLDDNAVYLYDIPTRQLIKRIELPGWTVVGERYSCAPDLALTPSGAALVTSNVLPTIWEVDPQSLVVRQHRLVTDADNDQDVGFSALAYTRDRRQLLGVSSLLGSLWRIDLVADKAYKVRLVAPMYGACGLAVLGKEHTKAERRSTVLCIFGARTARRVELTSDMREGRTNLAKCSM